MIRSLMFVLQVAGPGDPPAPPLAFSAVPRCPRDNVGDDVVVCGRADPDRYRLKPLPPRFDRDATRLPMAEVPLGGGTLGVTAQQGDVGGVSTNRAMLTWKLKF